MKNNDRQNWILTYDKFIPEQEGIREALCTLGNGYFATRGAGCESTADDVHYPGTYLAGGYNRLETEIGGKVIVNEDLVNLPNWLFLSFRINSGEWFNLKAVEILSFKQELNVKEGTLTRHIEFKDARDRISKVTEERFVHIKKPHLAAIKWSLVSVNWEGTLEISSALDGTVKNYGVKRYRELSHQHLIPVKSELSESGVLLLKVKTSQSDIHVALAAKNRVMYDGSLVRASKKEVKDGFVSQHFVVDMQRGKMVEVQKIVALYTSKDYAISEPLTEAENAIDKNHHFDELLESHKKEWESIWNLFGIDMEVKDQSHLHSPVLILRVHLFHLLQTVSQNTIDLDVGVPARGWHGEAYRGHIFWDELYIFPTLNFRMPEVTETLLKYRYRRLGEARELSQKEGYRGAMFPWQSGSSGREESQQMHLNPKSGRWLPDHSNLQRHVSVAIAYNVWRYFQTTGDYKFLSSYGAELILEIARFWASISEYNEELDRFEIKGVMGPDEYHEAYPNADKPGLNNNSYTNVMVVWVLMRALEILKIIPESIQKQLMKSLNIGPSEIELWENITKKMRICFQKDEIISQFEGYEDLKEFDWKGYRKKYGDIHRLDRILEAEGDSANNYKLSKQADLVMLFYLFSFDELSEIFYRLGYPFDQNTVKKNIEYYFQRTSHGSTLSRVVHSWVIARMQEKNSWNLFMEALKSDIEDIQGGTTAEGIHLGVMAGTVDIVQRCYTGMEIINDVLWFNPKLPEEVTSLHLKIFYKGHFMKLEVTHERFIISVQKSLAKPVLIGLHPNIYEIGSSDHKVFSLREKAHSS